MQARDKFKDGTPNGVYSPGGGPLMPKAKRKSDERVMHITTFMDTLQDNDPVAGPNQAKRHRLNRQRRTVAANRAAR